MNSIREFFNIYFTIDFLLIILIILLLIILVITIYLIRLQKIIKNKDITLEDLTESDHASSFELNFKDDDVVVNEYKENYIDDLEESTAIISTEELERINKERKELAGSIDNSTLINQYEEEQEKKAIISYDELLKNASSIKVNYKDEVSDGPIIKKVELEKPEIKRGYSYAAETEFLLKLREFRANLK